MAIKQNDSTYSFTRVSPEKRGRDTSFKYGGKVRQNHFEYVKVSCILCERFSFLSIIVTTKCKKAEKPLFIILSVVKV